MRMIVCIKQVPAAASASIDPLTKTIVRTGQKAVTNPFDLHALQLALDLLHGIKIKSCHVGSSGHLWYLLPD